MCIDHQFIFAIFMVTVHCVAGMCSVALLFAGACRSSKCGLDMIHCTKGDL